MTFNEGFRIPVPANALAVCALQLSVCSLGPQAQEELLVGLRGSAAVTLLPLGGVEVKLQLFRLHFSVCACRAKPR